jgi:SprT protein
LSENFEFLAEHWLEELLARFPLKKRPKLVWRNLRVSAGIADYRNCEIRLSRTLLTDAERLRSTLLHEFAHHLAYERAGRTGANHGEPWRQAMRDLGEKPEVYHRYEVERKLKFKPHVYRCLKCGSEFRRLRRIPRNRIYEHVNCGGRLRFDRTETSPPSVS